MYCWNCGNEISGTAEYCPYCGAEQKRQRTAGPAGGQNNSSFKPDYYIMAIIGLVLSCASLVYSLGGLLCLAGIIVSVIALVQINKNGLKGRGFAIAGIAVGGAELILSIISAVFYMSLGFNMLKCLWHGINSLY